MENSFNSIDCDDDDVLEIGEYTYKVNKLKQALKLASNASDNLPSQLHNELNRHKVIIQQPLSKTWFNEGIDCQILNLGSPTWKKGKVKFNLSIEFYIEEDMETTNNDIDPNKAESPLDDLRRMINEG